MNKTIEDISVSNYQCHWLHSGDTPWPQSNCYVDLWIEMLHALHLNPVASFAFTLATDFEGDQWTFFKVPLHDLYRLYGIDVQELLIWRPLPEQILTQTQRGRIVLVELDAFFLPDVHDTSYHQIHDKTTVGVQWIDLEAQEMHYFHNSGLHSLRGDDFRGIFHVGEEMVGLLALPPYVEYAKLDHLKRLEERDLTSLAIDLMHEHFARRPAQNPFIAYRRQFQEYLTTVTEQDLESFHKYAFATLRQYGACYEYASIFLKWLSDYYQGDALRNAASEFEAISSDSQILLLKTARAVRSKKSFDYQSFLEPMESHWDRAVAHIVSAG